MALGRSKLTKQGRISVPAAVRRKLGLGPGSIVEWDENDGRIVVRHARFTVDEIHRALFPDGPPKSHTIEEMNEGKRQYILERHARGRY